MELSNEVLEGLNYLAGGNHISDDNFKKIVNSCLGLLAGEQNIDRVSNICPEKGDVVKQCYASLLTFTIECIRRNSEEEIRPFLRKLNFKANRIEHYCKNFDSFKQTITRSLESCSSGWPNVIDTSWRLDFVVKSSLQNQVGEPLYYIVFTTERDGKLDYVKFTCDLHQLQDLTTKLKEIVCHIEKSFNALFKKVYYFALDQLIGGIMNSDLWNLWDVQPPPTCRTKQVLNRKVVSSLRQVLYEMSKCLKNVRHLDYEAAFLSKMLYKNHRTFRHDKGVRLMVKIYQCLKRYLKLDMIQVVENLKTNVPINFPKEATHTYLPTKQMLQWVLFRLQAFAKLFVRISELARMAAPLLYGKLVLGWALKIFLCFYAINSRLLALSKFLVLKSIEWYDSLFKHLGSLEMTAEFLPGHQFPSNLKKWLGDVDLAPPAGKSSLDEVFEMIDLSVDDGDDDVAIVRERLFKNLMKVNEITIDSDVEEIEMDGPQVEETGDIVIETPASSDPDLGVPVSRKGERGFKSEKWKPKKIGREKPYKRPMKKSNW